MDRKDAIEVIKKNWTDSSFTMLREALETLIPELKESEDESIRKSLSAYFDKFKPDDMWDEAISFGDIVAWLRKQDENANFCNKIQIGDNVTRNEDGVLVNLSQLKRVAKRGEQNLANSAKTCKVMQVTVVVIPKFRVGDVIRPKGSAAEYAIESISGECYHGKGWGLPISCEDDYELVIHNPAWSEEDEEMCKDIIQFIEKGWTDNGKSHLIPWIKDIKDRVQHQIQWKPSEGQIKTLDTILQFDNFSQSIKATLRELLVQLKEL